MENNKIMNTVREYVKENNTTGIISLDYGTFKVNVQENPDIDTRLAFIIKVVQDSYLVNAEILNGEPKPIRYLSNNAFDLYFTLVFTDLKLEVDDNGDASEIYQIAKTLRVRERAETESEYIRAWVQELRTSVDEYIAFENQRIIAIYSRSTATEDALEGIGMLVNKGIEFLISAITYSIGEYEGTLEFIQAFEASNYTERLTMLTTFVDDSIKELDRLRDAQNSLMGVASGSFGSTGNTNNPNAFGKGYNTDWDYAQLILDSNSWSEVETWADKRDQKIVGENITGVPTTEEVVQQWIAEQTKKGKRFANGGPADFTGPAWLDGTKQKPELVLDYIDVAKVYNVIHTSSDLGEELKEGAGEIKQASNQLFRFLGEGEHIKSLGISPDAFNSHVLQGYGLISPVIEHFKNMSSPNLPASNNISHSSQPVQIVFEGDMSFPNVNNAEQFANEIYMKFENRFSQQTIKL